MISWIQSILMFSWICNRLAETWNYRNSTRTGQSLVSSFNSVYDCDAANTMLLSCSATASDTFPVHIISLEGQILDVVAKPDSTIEGIKTIAVEHFYGQDKSKPSNKFRLVHASQFQQLTDNKNISDEGIRHQDELILVEIRSPNAKENSSDEILKGPSQEMIAQATKGLPLRNPPRPIPSTECPADFQNEIRKILISLVQASAKILNYSPDAGKLYDIMKEKLESRCNPKNDPKLVKNLVEMGFTAKKVIRAIQIKKSNVAEALEWLIEHQEDSDDESEEGDLEIPSPSSDEVDLNAAGPSSSKNTRRKKTMKETCTDLKEGEQESKEKNLVYIVELLLASCRHYKKLDFKSNARMQQSLVEMGFEEKKVIKALKITGNDHSNACEWLLGNRRQSLLDFDEGLDPEGIINKAIMNNPHIQLSLSNPKMLIAYFSMLETPISTNLWINDPEVSFVITQIFKTYHAEKHAMNMNRYTVQ